MKNPANRIVHLSYALYCTLLLAGPTPAQPFFTQVPQEIFLTSVGSAAIGDYDNDGRPDLFLMEPFSFRGRAGGRAMLLHNGGEDLFADRSAALKADLLSLNKGIGAVFADYDNDGDLDLYLPVGSTAEPGQDVLLRNDQGAFHDVTRAAGLLDNLPTDNAIWLDYNLDGHLDLYTGHWSPGNSTLRNQLYRNNQDGTFANTTATALPDIQLQSLGGGSAHGMVAGDFNDDGWPDLYLRDCFKTPGEPKARLPAPWARRLREAYPLRYADRRQRRATALAGVRRPPGVLKQSLSVWQGVNRLFLNDGQGGFRDATTSEIGDPGSAFGVAVGDIDNDGDLDLFQASGQTLQGVPSISTRSPLLLNLGEAQFLDVAEGVGLAALFGPEVTGPGLVDIDNDGDLDLLTADPSFLFLNNGDGTFVERTERAGLQLSIFLTFADFDSDGFMDAVSSTGTLYRNTGNDNHYLRVELVGFSSNRNGIGARLTATSGDLSQTREMVAGNGLTQDEMVAHFGLGPRTRVEKLEIRWPSGQVDVLENISADQKIRVFEGRTDYHPVRVVDWERPPPAGLVEGTTVDLHATLRPPLFEPGAAITRVAADLSALGGPPDVALAARGEGRYELNYSFEVAGPHGLKSVPIQIEQSTSLGPYWSNFLSALTVLPATDLEVFTDAGEAGWSLGLSLRLARLTSDPALDADPTFSPDGTKIAFISDRDGNLEIYTINADGANLVNLTNLSALDATPAFSPDGTKIAFFSDRDGNLEIYTINADGSNPVNLTNHPALDATPAFAPDGTKIAFISHRDGNFEVYLVDAQGVGPVGLNPAENGIVYQGDTSLKLKAEGAWVVEYVPAVPVVVEGYATLHFAFHPGDVVAAMDNSLRVSIGQPPDLGGPPPGDQPPDLEEPPPGVSISGGGAVELLHGNPEGFGVDLALREWQVVEIPLELFNLQGPIPPILFDGNLSGTFYLDDIRLRTAAHALTAVLEDRAATVPQRFALEQNFPNPFNSTTVIRFALPAPVPVELMLYNLMGQQVATLLKGRRAAGIYTLRWDGKDGQGHALASGVYLYRLRAGTRMETRKLLLLR